MFSKRKQLTLSAGLLIACFAALGFVWHSSSFLICASSVLCFALCGLFARNFVMDYAVRWVLIVLFMQPILRILAEYLALAPKPYGNCFMLQIVVPFAVGEFWCILLTSAIALPVLLIDALVRHGHWKRFFRISCIFVTSIVVLVVGTGAVYATRDAALVEVAEKTQPLIEAILRFEKDSGQTPEVLSDLVPKFIDRVPDTGLAISSKHQYKQLDNEHRWQLSIPCNLGMIHSDEFIYRPSHDYSDVEGGRAELVGTWAISMGGPD